MALQTKWLAVALVIVVVAASWLGWRETQWRRAYFADTTGHLIYDVDMAHRQLSRALETRVYLEKLDALATAHGYLVSAQTETGPLLERMEPFRTGRLAYMPKNYVPMLLQYARDLTPDLPDQALQKRIELVGGLEKALKAGLTDRTVEPGLAYEVDIAKLKQSLDDFFRSMPQGDQIGHSLRFEDDPNRPTVAARQRGNEVLLRIDWTQTFQLFPHLGRSYLILIRTDGLEVSSDADKQHRMGLGAFQSFTSMENDVNLHEAIKRALPADWTAGSYKAIRIPEGLPQTLSLRLPGSARPSLLLLAPTSGEKAVPIAVE